MKTNPLIHSVILTLLGTSLSVQADVVTDWNTAALIAIRSDRTTPPQASRNLAILHASIYDAVNGISRTHQPYLVQSTVPASASKEAAASAAAHKVLSTLFPAHAAEFDTLHESTLAQIPNGPREKKGLAWGAAVATQVLAQRANDGSAATVAAPIGGGLGDWIPTGPVPFLLPQWGFVTPFCMSSSAQFRPSGPPALDSEKYAQDFNEVKMFGGAVGSSRTEDQSLIARFWADGAGTETPPGHWNHIAQDVSAAQGNTLDQNARLFALLNLAMADAGICAWDAKYSFNNWRPVTAIRNAASDGNDATEPDAAWSSFIGTPPFPDYVSGHSTFSGAAATVLGIFYGSDDISFSTGSDFLPGVIRSFESFSSAANEAAMSRVYGGIHFRFASDDGLSGGLAIGEWTISHFLQTKGNRSRK
jgi:hypothetical protein